MTLLARKALADYLLTVHKIPEYIDALNASDPVALIVSELDRIEAATEWHTDGIFGLHQPARRPDGEGLDGHHKPGPDWQPGSKAVDTYVFVRSGATHSRAHRGFGLQTSIHPDGSGYLWLGECNNSAAHTPETPAETWALWVARRSVPEDAEAYRGPWYMGRTSPLGVGS